MTHEQWLIKKAINKGLESVEAAQVIALINIAIEVGRLKHLLKCSISTGEEIKTSERLIRDLKKSYK